MSVTIDALPNEILETIFSDVDARGLWACLGVCRRWRSVANADRFWKQHCLKFHIHQPAVSNLLDEIPLCRWATAFYHYFCRPAANWRKGSWRQLELPLKSTVCFQCWSGLHGYIYYFTLGRICVYTVTDDNLLELEDQINVEILNQDENHIFPTICCSEKYLAVGNCNTVLIFEKIDGHFRNSHCLAIHDEVVCCNEKEDFTLFIISNFSRDYILRVKHFLGDNLWLYDPVNRIFLVYNVVNNYVKFRLDYRYVFCRPKIPFLVSLSPASLEVYNSECEIVLKLEEDCISSVCFNGEILVANKLCLRKATTARRELESWDLETGRRLAVIPGSVRAKDFDISPVSSRLVILRVEESSYSIVCLCARTAQLYWRILEAISGSWYPEMQILMYEFVFVWPSYSDNDKYSLYDLRTGKLTKEQKKMPGEPFWITDLLWIIHNGDNVTVKSFL